jgi:molybdopterin/thiamine biosynthesis adenylyltransferase
MEERYIRNLGALTESECECLRKKKVFIAGCGGLGGYILEMLLRIGVGSIVAADGDTFERSNFNRQILAELPFLGKSKAMSAEQRARRVNPNVEFTAIPQFLDQDNVRIMISGSDVVMDALDNISSRKILSKACTELNIPMIHGAICGWTAQAAISLPGDGLLDLLYPEHAELSSKSSLSFTPPYCAAMQMALCVKLLCGRKVEPGKVYFADLLDMDFETLF